MSSDIYSVLPLPVHLGAIKDRQLNSIKPFVGVYFPVELLEKMGWTEKSKLKLSVEKGFLKIEKAGNDEEEFYFDINELKYEPENYD